MKLLERRRRRRVWRRDDFSRAPKRDRTRLKFDTGRSRGERPKAEPSGVGPAGEEAGARLRLRILVAVCMALGLTVVARLWYLQVLDHARFAGEANSNRVRFARDEAPRGRILAADGSILVDNRVSLSVGVELTELTKPAVRSRVVTRLSALLNLPKADIEKRIKYPKGSPIDAIPVADDVPQATVAYIREHQEDFPGVVPVLRPVRVYPQHSECPAEPETCPTLAPHVLGYVGETNQEDLARNKDYRLGDSIGRSGSESTYEKDLRGDPGIRKLEVNAVGRLLRTLGEQPPQQGDDVRLTLDPLVQRITETSLQEGLAAARTQFDKNTNTTYRAGAGAVVVLDPNTGGVVAMASNPAYDPAQFVGGIPTDVWKVLNDPANQYPMNNRAVQGQYAPGSTFKVVTAMAALAHGFISPKTTIAAGPYYQVGNRKFRDWKPGGHGATDLRKSLVESVDVYYYALGYNLYKQLSKADYLADTARKVHLGERTGIDVPGETPGRVPDENWKRAVHNANPAAFPDPRWYAGDSVNMSIGQGDVLVTPLQMAVLYAAIANGGTLYQPHVVDRVQTQSGRVVRGVPPQELGRLPVDRSILGLMAKALQGVVTEGTAKAAFDGYPHGQFPVAGKTGTAEAGKRQDFAWFVSFAPATDPRYVVAVVIEEGGHGGSTAAPVARRIYERIFGIESKGVVAGAVTD